MMIRKYVIKDAEVAGPGVSKRLHTIKECQKEYPGLVANGLVVHPNQLQEMLDIAYNEGIRNLQLEMQHKLGIK
jgi:hypothetical protein